MLDLKDSKVSIIGAGRSGISAAEVVKSLGAVPFVSDNSQIKDRSLKERLESLAIPYEVGGHTKRVIDCHMMVVSPGVAAGADVVTSARSAGVTVWPEIELAYRLCRGKIVGITGSNGKTTTTVLTGEIFKSAGLPAYVCGNIGHPFIDIAQDVPEDGYAVVELSSFQLELIEQFHVDLAVFLNLTPDHLDRHGTLENYTNAKMRIFENQSAGDVAIINRDDKILRQKATGLKGRVIWFSVGGHAPDGVSAVPGGSVSAGDHELMKADDIRIKGEHNLSNACAAAAAALSAGIGRKKIVETLKTFAGVEHRLEPVRLIGGVSFINDSKGTNVDSVYWALKAVSAPVILIAGGKDKAGDFGVLNSLVSEKVKLVVLIGQAGPKIEAAWGGLTRCVRAGSLEEAVAISYEEAAKGDRVLLSPGCASFDMFDNYEHRGRVFKKAVMELRPKEVYK
jgi:UDP-N-acetylmuramoylalanine--D-glutamate ligase